MSAAREAVLAARYVALTTFRRDGTPVVTPVWAGVEAGTLYLFSNPTAGKVKRIRNNGRVTVAPCTATGSLTGAAIDGSARLMDPAEMPTVWRILVGRYGIQARLFVVYDRLRRLLRRPGAAGIEVRLSA